MKKINEEETITQRIKSLRNEFLKKKSKWRKRDPNFPISFWIKEDRLWDDIGKEFTIILNTRGCAWALSESGGCSMCGYIQDSALEKIGTANLINQIDYAFNSKKQEIISDKNDYILKIFNSGSFLDDEEVPSKFREYLYKKIVQFDNIKEFVIESRVEFISKKKLLAIKGILKDIRIEIGIGIETMNEYIRNVYINKGLTNKALLRAINLCKELDLGIRAYLLLKPPFLTEQAAIDDCIESIKKLIQLGVDTISINPVNVQKGTLVEYLWFQNRYRPPWFYSLFHCLQKSITSQEILDNLRIISDPSGAGTRRGIHNCLKKNCEYSMKKFLSEFVLSQDINVLSMYDKMPKCECELIYQIQKNYH